MGMTAATLGAGAVQAVGSLVAGLLNMRQAELARKEESEWNKLQFKYGLEGQKAVEQQAKRTHALNVRQQKFLEEKEKTAEAERAEERGYGRVMASYKRAADVLNQNQINLAQRTAPLIKRA